MNAATSEEDKLWRDTLKRKWHQRQTDVFAVSCVPLYAVVTVAKMRPVYGIIRCVTFSRVFTPLRCVYLVRTCLNAT